MAGNRLPGPMCSVSKPIKIDEGTMCRSATPAPGPICAHKAKSSSGMYSHNLSAGPQKASKIDLDVLTVAAKTAAPGLGEQMIKEEKRLGINVDVAAQEHRHKSEYRKGSGKNVQSAHLVNSSSVSDVPGYIRGKAVTVLLPTNQHKAFDDYWKTWAREKLAKAKPGEEAKVTVAEWEEVLNKAIQSVPELRGRTADTISFMIRAELYQTLGLKPDQEIRIPYSTRN
jgi:hypothetical protein